MEKQLSEIQISHTAVKEIPEEEKAAEIPQFITAMDSIGDSLEKWIPQYAGCIYLLGFLLVVFVNTILAWEFMPNMPGVEFLFLVFFVSFPLNFYLLRATDVEPYLLDEKENLFAKIAACLIVCSVIFMLISLNYGYAKWTMCIMASTWLMAMIFENLFLNQIFFHFEILASVAMLLGVFVVQGVSFDNFNIDNFSAATALAIMASILLTAFIILLLSLNKKNSCGVLAHYVHVCLLLFFPLFMPFLGEIVAPSILQWCIIIICGLFNLKAGGFFFRSIQLQSNIKSRRILVTLNIAVFAFYCYEIIATRNLNIIRIGAALLVIVTSIFLMRKNPLFLEDESQVPVPFSPEKKIDDSQKPLLKDFE